MSSFLNTFKKQLMSFDYSLSEELIQESESIKSTLDSLVEFNSNKFKAFNYDLTKLLINCSLEEIKTLIYHANKEGKKKEEMSDYVLERIALTLPQDIIVNMKINGFEQKNSEIFKKIMEYYNRGEHSNFANYIKKVDKNKNIVCTFSHRTDDFDIIDGINNPLLGEIKRENIKEITLSSLKSENDIEKQLDEFFKENNNKICLIKILPHERYLMNYVNYFIKNKEKVYEKNPKKVFVFIVHMVRITKEVLDKIKKDTSEELNEIQKNISPEKLSDISDYYQIFIDNLNGEEQLTVDKIIHMNKSDLFENFLNVDKELCCNISKFTSYINYNIISPYKILNKDTYANILVEFINKNKKLRKLTNKCILNKILNINKNTNLIEKIFKTKDIINSEDIEIIGPKGKVLSKSSCIIPNRHIHRNKYSNFIS